MIAPPIILPEIYAHYPMSSNLGMLSNAALLEREGCEVRVVDALYAAPRLNVRRILGDLRHVGVELDVLEALLAAERPDVVLVVVTMYSDVHRLDETYVAEVTAMARRFHPAAAVAAADCYVCGINYLAYDPVRLLEALPALDAAVVGEGDHRLVEVVRRLGARASLAGLPQVAFREGGAIRWDPTPAPPTKDLDALPPPAFHLLDMGAYFACLADGIRQDLVHEYHEAERILPLMTSRGCSFACSFCTQQVLGLPWRGLSVETLKRTILALREAYRVERFFFLDNNINADPRRFAELAGWLADTHIPWDAVNGFRADLVEESALEAMARAGNAKVTVSAESGDPKVLTGLIGKRLDLKAVVRVARQARALDLPCQVHYIVGIPGESRESVNRTLEFALALYEEHEAWPLVQHSIPFRGTALTRRCKERGWFAVDPESVPGWELERRCVVETPELPADAVMRFKEVFGHLLDAMDTVVVVEPGAACNNRCLTCEEARGEAPSLEALLAEMKRRRGRGGRDLLVAGPEPTLRWAELLAVVEAGRALGFDRVTLATNGRLLADRARAAALDEEGLTYALVTLAGASRETHEAVTRTPGSFTETLAGVRNLARAGVRVDAAIRVTRPAADELDKAVALLGRLGARTVHLRVPAPVGEAARHPELVVPLPELVPRLVQLLRADHGVELTVEGLPFCLLPEELRDRAGPLPFFRLPLYRREKAKLDRCRGCTELMACLGFWRQEHEEIYRQAEALEAIERDS